MYLQRSKKKLDNTSLVTKICVILSLNVFCSLYVCFSLKRNTKGSNMTLNLLKETYTVISTVITAKKYLSKEAWEWSQYMNLVVLLRLTFNKGFKHSY